MATETSDGLNDHFRAVTVTTIAALAGITAALASSAITADAASAAEAARNSQAQYAVVLAILLQPPVLRLAGLLEDDFGVKDFLFLGFMTFSMWFVTWGIMLTTGASL